jgi:excinuclease ABC subunit C
MKNHKKYVYIKITINEEYPRILVAKEKSEDGELYFGPYTSQKSIEKAVTAIRDNLQVGNCSGTNISKSGSGCLNYQMGLCIGVCIDPELKNEYIKRINDIIAFLNGKDSSITDMIEGRMQEAAKRLDFIKAAKYRDDIYTLNHILNKQKVIKFSQKTRNITAIEPVDGDDVKIFLLYDSRLLHDEKVNITDMTKEAFKNHLKELSIKYFKPNIKKQIKEIEKEDIDEAQIIFSYLKNSKDCVYSLIPAAWLNEKGMEKLDKGIDKLVDRFYGE